MASRREPPDSLDYFPTPPWATRAFFEHVIPHLGNPHIASVWEPACGEGHMSWVIEEYVSIMRETDIFDYGQRDGVADFLDPNTKVSPCPDWIVTNPPFKTAVEFARLAFERASLGVALFVRTQWVEGKDRYEQLFRDRPPTLYAPFVERVPLVKGRWDPAASTATSYAWFVWLLDGVKADTRLFWIPPGRRKALTRSDDIRRFAAKADRPLFDPQPADPAE